MKRARGGDYSSSVCSEFLACTERAGRLHITLAVRGFSIVYRPNHPGDRPAAHLGARHIGIQMPLTACGNSPAKTLLGLVVATVCDSRTNERPWNITPFCRTRLDVGAPSSNTLPKSCFLEDRACLISFAPVSKSSQGQKTAVIAFPAKFCQVSFRSPQEPHGTDVSSFSFCFVFPLLRVSQVHRTMKKLCVQMDAFMRSSTFPLYDDVSTYRTDRHEGVGFPPAGEAYLSDAAGR